MAEHKAGGNGLSVIGALLFVLLWGALLVGYAGAFLPVPPSL